MPNRAAAKKGVAARSHSNDEKDKKGRYLRRESFSGTHAHKVAPESCNKPSGAVFISWYLFRREKSWYTENDNSEFQDVLEGCTALLEELR